MDQRETSSFIQLYKYYTGFDAKHLLIRDACQAQAEPANENILRPARLYYHPGVLIYLATM